MNGRALDYQIGASALAVVLRGVLAEKSAKAVLT